MIYTVDMSVDAIMQSEQFVRKFEAVAAEQPYFEAFLMRIADGRTIRVNTKDIRTAAEKILRKLPYKPHYSEEEIGDLLRGSIIAHDDADAQCLLAQLAQECTIIALDDYSKFPKCLGL